MKKYRILVADDDFKVAKDKRAIPIMNYFTNNWIAENENLSKKEEILKRLPTEFEVLLCATMDEFRKQINERDIHAFFIDYVLTDPERTKESGDYDEQSFNKILYAIKEKNIDAPIYIYSSRWEGKLLEELLKEFNDVFSNRVPNHILTFNTLDSAIKNCRLNLSSPDWIRIEHLEAERKKIWNAIAKARNHVPFQPSSPTGDLVILHISDLQFGDSYTSENSVGMWNDMATAIKEYLRENKLKNVDLIVITGDVAMTGKNSEYEEAFQELQTFFKWLWGNENETFRDRIIIVPGNHDFDINACVLEYFKAENKEKERVIDFSSVIEQIKKKTENEENGYRRWGLQAFREFAYRLTQEDQYILSDNLDFIIDKFNNWGLRFICLNSVYNINAQKTNYAGISNNSIKSMCDEISEGKELLTIILTHHTLLSTESLPSDEATSVEWAIKTLKRTADAKLVMGGHRHKNDKENDDENSAKKMLQTVEAASLRVEDKKDEYIRGFGVITIKSDLKKANLQYFIFNKQDGEIKLEKSYSCNFN